MARTRNVISDGAPVGVTTTSTVVVPRREGRLDIFIFNVSDTTIFLRPGGNPASLNQGIPLLPNTAYSTDTYTGQFTAIHGGTGTKNLLVTEYGEL